MNSCKIAYLSAHFSGKVKLDYLLQQGVAISTLITVPSGQAIQNKISGYFDFTVDAEEHSIPIYHARSFALSEDEDLRFFQDSNFDILLISGWQRLVPQDILKTLRIGAVAEHGSSEYLPRGRGRSPINWSIIQGRTRFALHIFMASDRADDGDIIAKTCFRINAHDDIYTIYAKVGIASGALFVEHLNELIQNTWTPLTPASVEPSWLPKRTSENDFIEWPTMSTMEIVNKVRAITSPYPGVKAIINDTMITIWLAQPFDSSLDDFNANFGQVLFKLPDQSFVVKTIDGQLLVRNYQYDGTVSVGDILI